MNIWEEETLGGTSSHSADSFACLPVRLFARSLVRSFARFPFRLFAHSFVYDTLKSSPMEDSEDVAYSSSARSIVNNASQESNLYSVFTTVARCRAKIEGKESV